MCNIGVNIVNNMKFPPIYGIGQTTNKMTTQQYIVQQSSSAKYNNDNGNNDNNSNTVMIHTLATQVYIPLRGGKEH